MKKFHSIRFVRPMLSLFAAFLLMVNAAVAGPPLICHAFDIGGAKSLPFVSHDWNLSGGENYNTQNLANDTLAILQGSQVALVHMETLRRATLYARTDQQAAKQLLLKIVARGQSSENTANPDGFALLDAAYLTEAYKQWLGEIDNPATSLDAYPWIKKAAQLRSSDPQMQFAAALITLRGADAAQHEFAEKAIAGAKTDDLLARNMSTHFLGTQSQTMAEMIQRNGETKVARQ